MNDYASVYRDYLVENRTEECIREHALETFENKKILNKYISDNDFSFKEFTIDELKEYILFDICDVYQEEYDYKKLIEDISLETFLLCFSSMYPTSIEEIIDKHSIDNSFGILHMIENINKDFEDGLDFEDFDHISDERLSIYAKFMYFDFDKFETKEEHTHYDTIEQVSPYAETEEDTTHVLRYLVFYKNLFKHREITNEKL